MRNMESEPLLPFDAPENEIDVASIENDDCTYCQDSGPCRYCKRGKQEAEAIKASAKTTRNATSPKVVKKVISR